MSPADIDPESLSSIFGTDDPMAFGTLLGDDIPETNLDDGFDPWGDLSDSAAAVPQALTSTPDNVQTPAAAAAERRSTLKTPVVGIRDQLDAEAAVPEFEDLADLGFSARPVTLQQLNLADPSYVEGMSDAPLADEYVSFDDIGSNDEDSSDDEAVGLTFGGHDDADPGSHGPVGLEHLVAGSAEVETDPIGIRGGDEFFDDFSIDVDDFAADAQEEPATVDLNDATAIPLEEEAAPAAADELGFDLDDGDLGFDLDDGDLGFDDGDLGFDDGDDGDNGDDDRDHAAGYASADPVFVAELADEELDFESALESREFQRVELDEAAFDDDGNDSRAAMLFGANEEINTPRVDPVLLNETRPAEPIDEDDELFGDDHDDDIGEIDLHLPKWSPLQGQQATEAVGLITGGVDDLLAQAESLLRRSRFEDANDLLNAALDRNPNHTAAAAMKAEVALHMDEAAFEVLGGMDGHPRLHIHPNDIVSLPIDSKGAYLLMQIDGEMTTADLLELSPMGHAATARLLAKFVADEVIVIVPPDPWDPRRPR
jgi:hypothetical protein